MGKLQKLLKGRSPEEEPTSHKKGTSSEASQPETSEVDNTKRSAMVDAGASSKSSSCDMGRIKNPTTRDVLFGRGKPFQSHPGNVYLHKIVNMHKERYLKSRRYDKLAIAEEIVSEIKQGSKGVPGRFLKRVEGEDYWVEVSNEVAREKVSHALRGKVRKYASGAGDLEATLLGVPSRAGVAAPVAGHDTGSAKSPFPFDMHSLQHAKNLRYEQELAGHQTPLRQQTNTANNSSLFPPTTGSLPGAGGRISAATPSFLNSLVGLGPLHSAEFPAAAAMAASGGLNPFLPRSNLDLMASRLAASSAAAVNQHQHLTGAAALGGINSSLLSAAAAAAGIGGNTNAPSPANAIGARSNDFGTITGADLAALARARANAREQMFARLAAQQQNGFSMDNGFRPPGGGAGGGFGPRFPPPPPPR